MNLRLAVLVAVLGLALGNDEVRYDNYRVHRIVPQTNEQVAALRELSTGRMFSFWNEPRKAGAPVMIQVAPHQRENFSDFLTMNNLVDNITIPDLQKRFDEEKAEMLRIEKTKVGKALDWNNYYSLEDIYAWLDSLAQSNPTVKVIVAGKSYEGREIRGIEITNGQNLPGVILESGIHAREWIAPAATSWVVNEILNSPADSVYKQFNYLYIPNLNPDGYEYTRNSDRAWRKTRTPYKGILGNTCYGADPNRNWDYKWNSGGSSNLPCDETYAGPKANSEIEVATVAAYLESVASRYDIYIGFHSFSQLLMYPWGYTGQDTPNEALWKRVGLAAAADLEAVHGTSFEVGSIYDTIYQASGSSLEWYYGKFSNKFAFVFELRDTGRYGFTLPPDQIIPSGEELIAAIQRFLKEYQAL